MRACVCVRERVCLCLKERPCCEGTCIVFVWRVMGERELVSESFLTVRERAVCVWMKGGGEKVCGCKRECE